MVNRLKILFLLTTALLLFSFLVSCQGAAFTVNFDSDGGTTVSAQQIIENETAKEPQEPTKEGYSFLGWYFGEEEWDFSTPITESITLKAKWKEITKLEVSFNPDSGKGDATVVNVISGECVSEPEVPVKEGYKFLGWYSGDVKWDFATPITEALTLTAKWEAIPKYTVSFNSDGGSAISQIIVYENEILTAPTAPTKEGFSFIGWYLGDAKWSFETDKVSSDITLVAKWEQIILNTPCTVSFNSDGGSAVAAVSVNKGEKIQAPALPTKDGYKFLGWFLADALWNFQENAVTADITLVAKWIKLYTVSFDSAGGSNVSSATVEEGGKLSEPEAPAKSGYKFLGWYLGEDKWNFTENKVTQDITLVAKWQKVYTVTFDSDGGSKVSPETVKAGEYATEPNVPNKKDYIFLGWYLGDEKWDFKENKVNSDITLKAKWTLEKVTFTGEFTYKDAVDVLASNWNPHSYIYDFDEYPRNYISQGLYSFYFNDGKYYKRDGAIPFRGYVVVPEMAASAPVDVTEDVRNAYPAFGIPEGVNKGYAYKIKLNEDAVWEDGTVINAETYVYSMKELLDPAAENYRASNYFSGGLGIANAENYCYQGKENFVDNYLYNNYTLADLTMGAGQYYSPNGKPMYIAIDYPLEWLAGNTLKDYVDAYGEEYFGMDNWDTVLSALDENGMLPLTDENNELLASVTATNPKWGETDGSALCNYYVEKDAYEADFSFDNVGIFASGEYEITLVFENPLTDFSLFYNLTANWIVHEELYESCKNYEDGTERWTTTYNTSKETTLSYGPYKITDYQPNTSMTFEKNESWYGYTDGKHVYCDPTDGRTYPMYQTTKIYCEALSDELTKEFLFLGGQLSTYTPSDDKISDYKDSEHCYSTPLETTYSLIFNGHKSAIMHRENAQDFDKSLYDLETLTLTNFRKAMALSFDRSDMRSTVSPSRIEAYGLIGTSYVYDPITGARYRDTEQAKRVLCDFYSVDVTKFESLDEAVASITAHNEERARELFEHAFYEAIACGYITDDNLDGISDQTIKITYALSAPAPSTTKILTYLNEKITEVTAGTPFEGKITFVESSPLGSDWSDMVKSGMTDTVLAGWSGDLTDPFVHVKNFTDPTRQIDSEWFDTASVMLTINVNVAKLGDEPQYKELTMSLRQWSDALNGDTVTVGEHTYCFGNTISDVNTRLDILAAIEGEILSTYNYIPMLQNGSLTVLSKQHYYVAKEYIPIIGRGGLAYLRYQYNDAEWADYVESLGGEVIY